MAFVEPLAVFFNPNDGLGRFEAQYLALGSSDDPVPVNGALDRAYTEAIDGVAEGSYPVFICAAADVPAAQHGDELAVDGSDFVIRGVHPDVTRDVVLLLLEEQA